MGILETRGDTGVWGMMIQLGTHRIILNPARRSGQIAFLGEKMGKCHVLFFRLPDKHRETSFQEFHGVIIPAPSSNDRCCANMAASCALSG
jgi:hypothetical protein